MKTYFKIVLLFVSFLFFCFTPKTLIKDSFQFKAITSVVWQSAKVSNKDTLIDMSNKPKWQMKFDTDYSYTAILNDTIKTKGRWAFNAKLNKIQLINTICDSKIFEIKSITMQELVYSYEKVTFIFYPTRP